MQHVNRASVVELPKHHVLINTKVLSQIDKKFVQKIYIISKRCLNIILSLFWVVFKIHRGRLSLLLKKQLAAKNRVCCRLQQPFRLIQQHQIWQDYLPTKGGGTWEVSFKFGQYFLNQSNLQQIVKMQHFAATTLFSACLAAFSMKGEVRIDQLGNFHAWK